jgi:hypothetical protein
MTGSRDAVTDVYLEVGKKRVFACAYEWPGWCRSGKDEQTALDALAAYITRYAAVITEAGTRRPATEFVVVERLTGDATTDFGAPGAIPDSDQKPLTPVQAKRLASLVAACWTVFDRNVAGAPLELRKGPRGGGRNRDKIVEHVLGAEVAYVRRLGLRHRQPSVGDTAAIADHRTAILDALQSATEARWPPRYTARRMAWHVMDHAWEIEDKAP